MSIMGLDYGSTTVGVAVTDALELTVQPLETITRKEENKLRRTCARIEEIIAERNVTELVLGCPYNMDGSVGERAEKTGEFAKMLARRTGLEIHMVDERLTTVEADEILDDCGIEKDKRKRKEYIDQVAAVLILEDYLNQKKRTVSDISGKDDV